MTMNQRNTIDLEQGWDFMQNEITKLKNILEGLPEPQFSSEDYMMLYTTIYNMCTQKPPHDYSQQLYDKYRESFEEYITSTVRMNSDHDGELYYEHLHGSVNSCLGTDYECCDLQTFQMVSLPAVFKLELVLPSLTEKHDEFMLRELVNRWLNHKIVIY